VVVVPMRVRSWDWNEVKSEELAGLSVALVGPSPWDPDRASSSKCLVMPLLPNLRKQIDLTHRIPHFAFKEYTRRRNGHANPKTAILRTRKT